MFVMLSEAKWHVPHYGTHAIVGHLWPCQMCHFVAKDSPQNGNLTLEF
jgi:hypothetical protein